MKERLDGARLRLSAAYPEMGDKERQRTVAHLADLDPEELQSLAANLIERVNKTSRELRILGLQYDLVSEAHLKRKGQL